MATYSKLLHEVLGDKWRDDLKRCEASFREAGFRKVVITKSGDDIQITLKRRNPFRRDVVFNSADEFLKASNNLDDAAIVTEPLLWMGSRLVVRK